jgi:hypothetical protein
MRIRRVALLVLFAALLLASCAGPAKLAQQSHEALAKGDLHKAYDRALRAVEKDPQNAAARAAYDDASRSVANDYRSRVRALAAADSVHAADLALEFRGFRTTVAQHGSSLQADEGYADEEDRILVSAAREFYRRGRAAMTARKPKEAWRNYGASQRYVDNYADVRTRQQDAWKAARSRVALLPFEDGIHVRGLSQAVAEQLDHEVAGHAGGSMNFTEFVSGDELAGTMTVAQANHMTREGALALCRRVGADRAVVGRFIGMRSNNELKDLTLPVYRRVERKGENGETVTEWLESTLRVVTRERELTLNWEFDVVDAKSGAVLSHRSLPATCAARVVWTDFKPEGDCDRYALLPPDVRRSDAARAKRVDTQWEERVGSWTLPSLLTRAREERGRARWSKEYRGEFRGVESRRRPVWLGELPGEDDMAFVALDGAWRSVLTALQELDARD